MEIKEEEVWKLVKKLPAYIELSRKTPQVDVLDLLKKKTEVDQIINKILDEKIKELEK